MLQLIWSHGWGFDATFFTPLLRTLPEYEHFVIDWGYFGNRPFPQPQPGDSWVMRNFEDCIDALSPQKNLEVMVSPDLSRPIIGIGHSLGFAKLFDLPFSYESVISLGGFTRFCQTDNFTTGTPKRILQRMLDRFQSHPQQVLQDFYRSCGFTQHYMPPSCLNLEKLSKDLKQLMQVNITIPEITHFALAGKNDQICPLSQQQAMFTSLQIIDGAHNFPVTKHQEAASSIRQFLVETTA